MYRYWFAALLPAIVCVASIAVAGDTNFTGRVIAQSTDTPPTCATATGSGDICAADAIEANGALDVAGNAALAGTLTVTGATTYAATTTFNGAVVLSQTLLSGQLTGFEDQDSDGTLAVADCGTTEYTLTDAAVITLPAVAAANAGCVFTILNTAADDASLISVSPAAADGINGTCCGLDDSATTTCVHLSGANDKDLQNTKATQNKGDMVKLVSDGVADWYVLSCIGIWASES